MYHRRGFNGKVLRQACGPSNGVPQEFTIELKVNTIFELYRFTARSSCKVDLRDYPLDDQICHLAFESCKYHHCVSKYYA